MKVKELKKYSNEELLEMYWQLNAEMEKRGMEKRGLYKKYLKAKGAGAIELDKAVQKSFEDLYIPMTEKK